MLVETIGDAFGLGWRVTVRCSYGREDSPRSQSSRECNYRKDLDMETLVWTRGRAFPLSRLESRLRVRAAAHAMWWCCISRRAAPRRAKYSSLPKRQCLTSVTDCDIGILHLAHSRASPVTAGLMERVRFLRAGLVTPLPGGPGIVPSDITTGVQGALLKRE